jgi:ABC-type polysaccharide/polyol phosphate transport system ATPase subunit
MKNISVRADNLGKWYRIGERAHDRNVREAVNAALVAPWRMLRRREGPRFRGRAPAPSIWALRNVSFELRQGELLGIVGINGAGKSTLLKILSRITEPTEGTAEMHGHVRALLEVGSGFHPQLTGRENVYLNGAILGMKRAEVARKFDEIVAFAEIERFIDTPVRWYSTGMYARLAFSVAAHLEPDVLIVDEVLAVGDVGFQRKCIAKMGAVAAGGRTVIFVSHMLYAVEQLTERCLVLKDGLLVFDGPTPDGLRLYQSFMKDPNEQAGVYDAPPSVGHNHVTAARVLTSSPMGVQDWGGPITFEFDLEITEPHSSLCFSFQVLNEQKQPVCHFWLYDAEVPYRREKGVFRLQCYVPKFRLYMGAYTLRTWLTERRSNTVIEQLDDICPFEVSMQGVHRDEYHWEPGSAAYLDDSIWLPVESVGSGASDGQTRPSLLAAGAGGSARA